MAVSRNEEFHSANSAYLHEVRDFDGEPHHLAGWHMTDNPDFQYDPSHTPSDYINARPGKGDLFYTLSPENWGKERYGRPYAAEVWRKGPAPTLDIDEHDQYDGTHFLRSGQFRIGAVIPSRQAEENSPIVEHDTQSQDELGRVNQLLTALRYSAKYPGAPVTMLRGDEVKTVRYRRAVK